MSGASGDPPAGDLATAEPQPGSAPGPGSGWQARVGWAVVAGVGAAALVGVLYYLKTQHWRYATVQGAAPWGQTFAYALLVAAVIAVHAVPDRWRRPVLAAFSLAGAAALLRWWVLPVLGMVAALCLLSRSRLRLRWQLLLTLAGWLCLPLVRHATFPKEQRQLTFYLMVLWAALIYSAVFFLVDSARRRHLERPLVDDLVYLLVLPRFVEPFFQPISPGLLRDRQQATMSWSLWGRGMALGLYGSGLAVLFTLLNRHLGPATPLSTRLPLDFLGDYARAAHQIFVSVALLRLLGYDLPAGFRLPFLATSFQDFFRRWNHYIRDAVVELFYYPCLGWLRRHIGRRAATAAAAYAAIFLGALLLNTLAVAIATRPTTGKALAATFDPLTTMVHLFFWSAIILPRTLGTRAGAWNRGWHRVAATAAFLVLYCAFWTMRWLVVELG